MSGDTNNQDLKQLLADAFYLNEDIIAIIQDAGIRPQLINVEGKAVNVWSNVLYYASRNNKVPDLLKVALARQPDNQVLKAALEASLSPAPPAKTEAGNPFQRLEQFVELAKRFNNDQLSELVALVLAAEIEEKQLRLVYSTTGRNMVNSLPSAANLSEMLKNLADTQFGLFEFILRLAFDLPGGMKNSLLGKWVTKVRATLPDEEKQEIASIQKTLKTEQQQKTAVEPTPYLLLKIEEVLNSKGKRELALNGAWLKPVGGDIQPLDIGQQSINSKNFGLFFDQLQENKIADATVAAEKLMVEIYLPPKLLAQSKLSFEWFEIDGGKRPLGTVYNVVYRYTGRTKTYQSAWQRKSELLKNGATWDENLIWYCGSAYNQWPQISEKVYPDDDYVLLGGSLALLETNRVHLEVIESLKLSGLPAFLWFRQMPTNPAYVTTKLNFLINKKGLARLPTLVKELRRGVKNDPNGHHFQHLTLLWDDFSRQIPHGNLISKL